VQRGQRRQIGVERARHGVSVGVDIIHQRDVGDRRPQGLQGRHHLGADQRVEVDRIFGRRGAAQLLGRVEHEIAVDVVFGDQPDVRNAGDQDILGADLDELAELGEHFRRCGVERRVGRSLRRRRAAARHQAAHIVAAHRDQIERPRIGIAIDRVAERVGLPVEVGHDFIPLADLRAAVGEIQIDAVRVRGERSDLDAQPRIFEKIGEDRLGDHADRLVGDQVGEIVPIGKAALEIAQAAGRSALGKVAERKAVIPLRKLERVARIDQAVPEHVNAAVRHHALPPRQCDSLCHWPRRGGFTKFVAKTIG
jgi:hypothetical protein